jgi:hypothetical protein
MIREDIFYKGKDHYAFAIRKKRGTVSDEGYSYFIFFRKWSNKDNSKENGSHM